MPQPLYSRGNSPQYPLDKRLSGPYGQFGCSGRDKKTPASTKNQNPVIKPTA